jgi:ABC-2 type transport system permease protein
MKNLFLLLSVRMLALKNSISSADRGARKKALVMIAVGLIFWTLMFVLSSRVLSYFRSTEIIGDILANYLLSMLFLTFFSLLVFSNIITSLSNLYLSADLELCHSSPASLEEVFISRVIFTLFDSSWMVIIFGLPVMMAYGWVFKPGPLFYFDLFHLGFALSIIASAIGILITVTLVSIFPAQKTRDIIMIFMVFAVIALYLMFRMIRPERLVDPDAFFSIMQYVSVLEAPDHPFLPTNWITGVLWSHISRRAGGSNLFNIMLLWSTAIALMVINTWVAGAVYFNGFSKSQEAKRRRAGKGFLDMAVRLMKKPMGEDTGAILEKDVRIFFRDNTQWSQLLLLGALVAVYLYNFSVLPLERSAIRLDFLQNTVAFLNLGLASFVLASISVRFVFPAVSSEGKSFWIIRKSPLSIKRFLVGKYLIYIFPMLLLGEILIIATNRLLDVSLFMMVLSSVTMFFSVFAIVSLGIGLGALYPRFKYENITQVSTGFGGLVYMIISAIYMAVIIMLEAGPVYIFFNADLFKRSITSGEWIMIWGSFILVIAITLFTIYKPIRMGIEALKKFE